MRSPVVLGLKPQNAEDLRADYGGKLTWSNLQDAAHKGVLRFAMTDPIRSNSGFAAMASVASANPSLDFLSGFYKGPRLRADTSGVLADRYGRSNDSSLQGMVNYESVLESGFAGKLERIYPDDGAVEADYPLVLVDPAKRAAYDKAVQWLLSKDAQQQIM